MACDGPEMVDIAYAAILQILLCLSLDITAPDLAVLLDLPKDTFLPLQAAQLLSVAQLVWSRTGGSQCSLLAIQVPSSSPAPPCLSGAFTTSNLVPLPCDDVSLFLRTSWPWLRAA